MHLDLSNTGLTKTMFDLITKVWHKVMSLSSFHASGNPFINELTNLEELRATLKAKPIMDQDSMP